MLGLLNILQDLSVHVWEGSQGPGMEFLPLGCGGGTLFKARIPLQATLWRDGGVANPARTQERVTRYSVSSGHALACAAWTRC